MMIPNAGTSYDFGSLMMKHALIFIALFSSRGFQIIELAVSMLLQTFFTLGMVYK